jgi:putative ABC transport system ATP-binding protein
MNVQGLAGPESMSFLSLRDVSKRYRSGDETIAVLAGLDLEVAKGEMVLIMGPSGSGKTTLMNAIGGIERPDSGTITLDDVEVTSLDRHRLNDYRRNDVGFVFQFYNLIPTLTARENVVLALEGRDLRRSEMNGTSAHFLKLVGLEDKLDRFPQELSAGQQQRVAIARALAKGPKLVLADEPTGNLDEDSEAVVLDLLARLRKETGMTVMVVSHNSRLKERMDRCYTLRRGQLHEN